MSLREPSKLLRGEESDLHTSTRAVNQKVDMKGESQIHFETLKAGSILQPAPPQPHRESRRRRATTGKNSSRAESETEEEIQHQKQRYIGGEGQTG
ncbi:hypothetical protein Bca52824_000929 [Brassica carinata]|uniref:Uncharacterized protein n=1 Tax=Brassica carinata TaxID=52824 RepID=A0A8X7WHD7_BRACI|nr:hypothetical protein Bca52824_000929 [Brassica carinata]